MSSRLSRAVVLGIAAMAFGPLAVAACASSDESAPLSSGGAAGDASIDTGSGGTAGSAGSSGSGGSAGTAGSAGSAGSAGFGGSGGGTGGSSGSSGSGGSTGTCNPAFCPSVGTGTPCCITPNGPCGVDYGFGNGCEQPTGPDV